VNRDVLFFDLDGTLIDSAVGITRCVAHALECMQHPVPPQEELRRWIGPALRTSFAPLFHDAQRVEQAVLHYRERFESHGWREHEIYPDIGDVVQELHAAGHLLAVVTAKNEPHAGASSNTCRSATASPMSSAPPRTARAATSRS
jgi:Predicted phosphatases